eukprot:m.56596 g.56596  ORF g.56596 m.56596 type:complete len:438 (+) comp13402_c0_seq1:491-1804(+)
MALNVNRNVQDVFYRYKMPRLLAKVEGKGNGIKTVIPNMVEIARALDRPASYPTKYFGCELGAQVQMEEKNERFIVNGEHQASRLQDLLDGFIQKFVLCAACENPETKLRVTSKRQIEQTCVACGHRCFLPETHKLFTFIINHPPNATADKKAGKEDKKDKKDKKGGDSPATPTTPDSDMASIRDNAAQRERGVLVDAPKAVGDDDDADLDWSEDTSEEAVRLRQQALGAGVASLTLTDDLERSMNDRLNFFHTFVKARKDKYTVKEILTEADRLDCREKAVMILAEIFWDSDDLVALVDKHTELFLAFCEENQKSQRYLLGAIEKIVEGHKSLLSKIPKIFNALYKNDIVDEEVFIAWDAKVSKKYVSKELNQQIHDVAKAFIEWLKTADEEESEEEESDEDDVKVVYDTNAANGKAAGKKESAEEEADDLDIDAI